VAASVRQQRHVAGVERIAHRVRALSRYREAMLIYSMSVSVDGFIADREGAFGRPSPPCDASVPSLPRPFASPS
jgi:hypothetical protein